MHTKTEHLVFICTQAHRQGGVIAVQRDSSDMSQIQSKEE